MLTHKLLVQNLGTEVFETARGYGRLLPHDREVRNGARSARAHQTCSLCRITFLLDGTTYLLWHTASVCLVLKFESLKAYQHCPHMPQDLRGLADSEDIGTNLQKGAVRVWVNRGFLPSLCLLGAKKGLLGSACTHL